MRKKLLAILAITIFAMALVFASTQTFALDVNSVATGACSGGFSGGECSACAGINELDSTQNCASGGSGVSNIIKVTVNILSYVLGVIAVIMLIIGGVRFATSGGNSQSVGSAKTTIIYALIGLVVAAIAQVLVHWVLNTSASATSGLVFFTHYLY